MEAKPRLQRLASAAILAAGLLALVHSLAWRGARFPGFFLMPNRVVPSVALEGWSGIREGRPVYQQLLLAVDDQPVADATEGYRQAARHAAGEPVRYLFTRGQQPETRTFPLRVLGDGEYLAIFGTYFLSGLAYLVLAFFAAERWREGAMFRGLAAFGWAGAAFSFTGMDLYGPGLMFRLHVLAEAILPAAAAHLALTCPRDHLARRPGLLLVGYGVALVLAAIYELFLYDPSAYTVIHDLCQSLSIVPVLAFTVALGLAVGEPPAELGALAVRRLLVGAVAGIVLPAVVLAVSGVSGGLVPVNVTAWVGFVFPLAALATFRLRPAALAAV